MRRRIPLLPGRFYHIYNRGNNRENLFIEERNYHYFMRLHAKCVGPVADTYAFCLLKNHFHFLVRVKDVTDIEGAVSEERAIQLIGRGFQHWFATYAKAMNKAYDRIGKLFQEHFGRVEVDSDAYFTNLVFYIHFNPQRHALVDDFRNWPWSSYHALTTHRDTDLRRDEVLAWFDGRTRLKRFHCGAADEKMLAALIGNDFV